MTSNGDANHIPPSELVPSVAQPSTGSNVPGSFPSEEKGRRDTIKFLTENPPESTSLDELDTDIAGFDYLLRQISKRRASICRMRNRRILISALPVELISEIFLFAFSSSTNFAAEFSKPTMLPLVLGRVCSGWREVAWKLTELWATVHCRVSRSRSAAQADLMSEWLARSGSRLLSIRISLDDEDSWQDEVTPTEVVSVINGHARRWSELILTLPSSWYETFKMSLYSRDVDPSHSSHFHSLTLRPPGLGFIQHHLEVFDLVPQLRELSITRYYLRYLILVWDNLTKVSLTNASTDEALEVIRRCPNLINCELMEMCPIEDEFPLPIIPITRPTLQILQVGVQANPLAALATFLELLTLPSLHELSLTQSDMIPLSLVRDLVSRSSMPACPLQKLHIYGTLLAEEDIVDMLQSIKSLRSITNLLSAV